MRVLTLKVVVASRQEIFRLTLPAGDGKKEMIQLTLMVLEGKVEENGPVKPLAREGRRHKLRVLTWYF